MDQNVGEAAILRQSRATLRSLVGEEWLEEQLEQREKERNRKGPIERILLIKPAHPVVEWEAQAREWIAAAENAIPGPDAAIFEFVQTALIVQHASRLPNGRAYLESLRHMIVNQRTTPTAIRQFWDLIFEGEAALFWATAGNVVEFGEPGGNPDLWLLVPDPQDPGNIWRIPIECWRPERSIETTAEFEDVWVQLQRRLLRVSRQVDLALKIAIRTQTPVSIEDMEPLITEVQALIPEATTASGSWVTTSTSAGRFQVSIGDISEIAKDEVIDNFGTEAIDMASEPPLTLAVRGIQTDEGIRGEGIALALRPTTDPNWIVDHVTDRIVSKVDQLDKSCGPATAPVGMIAVRLYRIDRSTLHEIDLEVRQAISGRDHVAAVKLYVEEDFSERASLGEGRTEVTQGKRVLPYTIVNDTSPGLPGLEDSRDAYFDPEDLRGTVVDAGSGLMQRTGYGSDNEPELGEVRELGEWPEGIGEKLERSLDPREDGFAMKLEDPSEVFEAQGDYLVLQVKSGSSVFRLVRDSHLNLRWLRLGERGRIRDHVVLDMRPFRGAKELLIGATWDEDEWRLILGSDKEGHEVEARRPR